MRFWNEAAGERDWVACAPVGPTLHAAKMGQRADGRAQLRWLWQAPLPQGGDGQTANAPSPQLSAALRALRRGHRLHGLPLVGVLDRQQYRLVPTEAPEVPRAEWRDALRWKLRDLVNFPVQDAALDVLEVQHDAQLRRPPSALAVVAPRAEPLRMAEDADDAGLAWSAIDVCETALRNLSALAESEGRAHALLAFGDTHGTLVVTAGGELLMTRQIEVPAQALVPGEGGQANPNQGAALDRTGLEVQRTLDSFERLFTHVSLAQLSLVAPPGSGSVLLDALRDIVYVPVRPFPLHELLDLSALDESEAGRLSEAATLGELCAMGAALRPRPAQSINLLDASMSLRPARWGATLGLRLTAGVVGMGVLAGAALSYTGVRLSQRARQLEQQLAPLQQAASALPFAQQIAEMNTLRQMQARQQRVRQTLNQALATANGGYSDYLMALGRQAQPALWITGLTLHADRTLDLSGRMTDPAHLPQYLHHLEGEDRFKGRRFAQIEMKAVPDAAAEDGTVTEFVLRSEERAGKPGSGTPAGVTR